MSDDYQSIPVAVARAAVQASGELLALKGPEYWVGPREAFGSPWMPMFAPTEEKPHPGFARVMITRKGQEPREVVISWDEYAAELEIDDPEWLAKRQQKPMSIFGAEVERHAYRVVFADILAPLLAPARIAAGADGIVPPEPWAVTQTPITRTEIRDWFAEVKAADAQTLNGLYDEARDAGALVSVAGLQQAFTDRLIELSQAPKPTPTQPKPQQGNRRRRGKRPENGQR